MGTGEYGENNAEMIDVEDASFNCTVSQFPTTVYSATGGLVGDTPLICGGIHSRVSQKSCYSLRGDGTWKLESNLNTTRQYAANGEVIMNNKLVIAGGYRGDNGYYLDTIE